VFRLIGLDEAGLRSVLDAQSRESLSYPEAGGTRASELPVGYTHDHYSVVLGDGVFEKAKRGLREWRPHLDAGVSVFPRSPAIEPDTDVVLSFRTGPLLAIAACRIVYVSDEPDRFGFAYGTLPERPEMGEEAFIVERDADDRVRFTITAFSRPASAITRLANPIARVVQQRVTRRYLEALRKGLLLDDQ